MLLSRTRKLQHLRAFRAFPCQFFRQQEATVTKSMADVTIIEALDDNYMYLVRCPKTNEAAVVDPVEPAKVLQVVKDKGVNLTTILTTHHHWDHAGGNEQLLQLKAGLAVYGGDERIKGLTHLVNRDDVAIQIGSLSAITKFTPCHTTGHVCYFIAGDDAKAPVVFTGDTLFTAGCGRFFEGTAAQMQIAMNKLSELPGETLVFNGHEYTVNNLKFAQHVEPNNQLTKNKLEWAKARRASNQPSIPSTIDEEKSFNPFMRTGESSVQRHVDQTDPVATMKALRAEKDTFKAA